MKAVNIYEGLESPQAREQWARDIIRLHLCLNASKELNVSEKYKTIEFMNLTQDDYKKDLFASVYKEVSFLICDTLLRFSMSEKFAEYEKQSKHHDDPFYFEKDPPLISPLSPKRFSQSFIKIVSPTKKRRSLDRRKQERAENGELKALRRISFKYENVSPQDVRSQSLPFEPRAPVCESSHDNPIETRPRSLSKLRAWLKNQRVNDHLYEVQPKTLDLSESGDGSDRPRATSLHDFIQDIESPCDSSDRHSPQTSSPLTSPTKNNTNQITISFSPPRFLNFLKGVSKQPK